MASPNSSSSTPSDVAPRNVVLGVPAAPPRIFYMNHRPREPEPAAPEAARLTFRELCPPITITMAFISMVVMLFFLLVAYILTETLKPDIPVVRVTSGTISNVTFSPSGMIAGECNVTVGLINTNRFYKTIFARTEMALLYPSQEVTLAQYYRTMFEQPGKIETEIEISFDFSEIPMGNKTSKAFKKDLKAAENLMLGIKVIAVMWHEGWLGWKTETRMVMAYCDDLVFRFEYSKGVMNGLLLDPVRYCQVYRSPN